MKKLFILLSMMMLTSPFAYAVNCANYNITNCAAQPGCTMKYTPSQEKTPEGHPKTTQAECVAR